MILKELFSQANYENIVNKIIETYPNEEKNRNRYIHFLNKLNNTEAAKETPEGELIVYVKAVRNIIDVNEIYHEVNGYSKKDNKSYSCEYFLPNEWLCMEVSENSLKHYGIDNFLAHILWEMTLISFEENELKARISYMNDLSENFYIELNRQMLERTKDTNYSLIDNFIDIEDDPNVPTEEEIEFIIKENNRIEREMLGIHANKV